MRAITTAHSLPLPALCLLGDSRWPAGLLPDGSGTEQKLFVRHLRAALLLSYNISSTLSETGISKIVQEYRLVLLISSGLFKSNFYKWFLWLYCKYSALLVWKVAILSPSIDLYTGQWEKNKYKLCPALYRWNLAACFMLAQEQVISLLKLWV